MDKKTDQGKGVKGPNLFALLTPYRGVVLVLVVLALCANAIILWLPKITSRGIDTFLKSGLVGSTVLWEFGVAAAVIFICTYLQNIVQVYVSERVARDLRHTLSEQISNRTFAFVQEVTPGKLLTNLTSDIDSVKNFVAQAVANIISSAFLIVGGSVLLLSINWRLGVAVLAILPIIAGTFGFVLGRVRKLFTQTREVLDWLNKVINESILGAALVRVLHAEDAEYKKFEQANSNARDLGLKILGVFSSMIPIISFVANLATVIILLVGGRFVINGSMSLGDFTAFTSYVAILIFPIFVIGFMSNIIAQAQASYTRVAQVLSAQDSMASGTLTEPLTGHIEVKKVNLVFDGKSALKDVSFTIQPGSKTAILGPTAAGKTQLLNVLIGLVEPSSGMVAYNGKDIHAFDRESLHRQIGIVFQDSIIFNMSIRENIAFNMDVSEVDLQRAIETAELAEFIRGLPEGLNTIVSERGLSLSGGQKQRIMLARSLALNPHILLLDDFTARVDAQTERKILENIAQNFPALTLLSVTQKVAAVEHYDQIIVLLEGEVIASGTHEHLLATSPEYAQIYYSQQSTSAYELQS